MRLLPLRDEAQLAAVRARLPLFYDACLPTLPADDDGARCAVVWDADALAVLQQRPPYAGPGATVTLRALVLPRRAGLARLLAFLAEFLRELDPWVRRLSVNLHAAAVHLGPDLTRAEVEDALRAHAFRPLPSSGGPPPSPPPEPAATLGGSDDDDDDPGEAPVA